MNPANHLHPRAPTGVRIPRIARIARTARVGTALLLACATTLRAQTPAPAPPLFTRGDAIWSAAFLAGSIALSTADIRITRYTLAHHGATRDKAARIAGKFQEGTLTIGNLALWGIGRLARVPALADVGFHASEAVAAGSVAAQLIRGPLGRSRPYASNYSDQYDFHWFQGFGNFKYRAYPSIHTVAAFGVATVYTLETKRRAPHAVWIVAPIAYTLAAAPGISRLYQGQHWASDVLAGAFLGVLAGAKVVRYNHRVNPANGVNRFFLGDENVRLGFSSSGLSVNYAATF